MKTLLLVRHAKSSWDDEGLADRDRSLSDRGERDAPKMGKRLARREVEPGRILSSPAVRALATARIMAKQLGYPRKRIAVDERLYPGEADVLLEAIREQGDELECVMLVSHNPGLTELAHRFAGEITDLPTCAVAEFEFDAASWQQIGRAGLVKCRLDYPKKA